MFCDLAKAFECVNHSTLVLKLNWYGINGKANIWIKSCLVDRCQRVKIKNINLSHQIASKCGKIRDDIPQGSILGPFLFLFSINYKSKPVLFADDTSRILTNSNHTNFISGIDHIQILK
jgi:hypothetical protein